MVEKKYIKIIEEPSYWVEEINNQMYDAMVRYMEANNLNKTEFSKYLGISKGRLSQILNDGEINFSIEKLCSISLKIGKIPSFTFEEKQSYIENIKGKYPTETEPLYSKKLINPKILLNKVVKSENDH